MYRRLNIGARTGTLSLFQTDSVIYWTSPHVQYYIGVKYLRKAQHGWDNSDTMLNLDQV